MARTASPIAAALLLLVIGTCLAGQSREDWAQIATDDLHFIRDTLRDNHPGPVDAANPRFMEWFEQGFVEALDLAGRAENYAGYYFAIQYYMQGFQDGHLGALGDDRLAIDEIGRRWPGFIVGLRGDRFVVVEAEPGSKGTPGRGAVLLSCDGQSPAWWAKELLQNYIGLWTVRGARPRIAPFLLIDEGNPFVEKPESCLFELDENTTRVDLNWSPISNDTLSAKVEAARQHVVPPIGIHAFGENGFWITVSSFNASSDTVDSALQQLNRRLQAQADEIRSASVVAVDVRGNTGGDSSYGTLIASSIWGDAYVQYTRPTADAVDWRISPGNVRFMREFNLERSRRRFGSESEHVQELEDLVGKMEAALARGDTYYRAEAAGAERLPVPSPVSSQVFLLTDSYCGSACLNFADLLLSMDGVTHIGRETSADAIYIDNRSERLPSGKGRVGFSMKVYRGRPRGHNEPYVPRHEWTGRMDDTAGLQEWVLSLAGRH